MKAVLYAVDFTPLADAVSTDPITGRRPYERLPIVRAHFAAYLTKPKIDSIVTLHLTLMRDAGLRETCGFSGHVPSRSTFSRVFTAMAEHPEIVDRCAADVVANDSGDRPRPGRGDCGGLDSRALVLQFATEIPLPTRTPRGAGTTGLEPRTVASGCGGTKPTS